MLASLLLSMILLLEAAMEKITRPQTREAIPSADLDSNAQINVEESLLRNALLLIDNGDLKSASTLLRELLAKNAYNLDAIEWLGYCFRKSGDLENAGRCYAQLVKHCPDEYSYAGLAEVYYDMGLEAEAEHFYKLALGEITYESPLLFQIHKNLGNIAIRLGDYENAEENYSKAYALNQHSDALFVNYGTLAIQKGEYDLAAERFKEAITLNAQSDKAWVGLAIVHWEKGDRPLAIANIERALDINPNNDTAIRLYADWCVREGRLTNAIEKVEAFVGVAADAQISLILVELLYRLGNIQRAELELSRAEALGAEQVRVEKWKNILAAEVPHA
jgi:tetratricopeptide (TPR) repeat protein